MMAFGPNTAKCELKYTKLAFITCSTAMSTNSYAT